MKKKILIITSKGLSKSSLIGFKKKFGNQASIVFCIDNLIEIPSLCAEVLALEKSLLKVAQEIKK